MSKQINRPITIKLHENEALRSQLAAFKVREMIRRHNILLGKDSK